MTARRAPVRLLLWFWLAAATAFAAEKRPVIGLSLDTEGAEKPA